MEIHSRLLDCRGRGGRGGGIRLQLLLVVVCLGVLRVEVSSKVDLTLKGSRTKIARKGLESGVFARMGDEVGGLAKGLPTQAAAIGLLA